MDVWALASGSSGNAYLVRSGGTALLVECGISLSRVVAHIRERGLAPGELAGVLLTHDHVDHIRSARQLSDRFGVPLYATAGTLGHRSLRDAALARPLVPGRRTRIGELEVLQFRVPHDASEPVGYRLFAHEATVCVTTDLGFVPDEVIPGFRDNDLLILEANHDEEMLTNGPYPSFLKRRVLGEHGHLSNRATAEALAACGDRVAPQVWLAHLSQVNNSISRAIRDITGRLAACGLGHVEVAVARRNRPSLRWSSEPRERQLRLL
jgi:phosphoribosyl 1,2-cyclic phosphodiesterase